MSSDDVHNDRMSTDPPVILDDAGNDMSNNYAVESVIGNVDNSTVSTPLENRAEVAGSDHEPGPPQVHAEHQLAVKSSECGGEQVGDDDTPIQKVDSQLQEALSLPLAGSLSGEMEEGRSGLSKTRA